MQQHRAIRRNQASHRVLDERHGPGWQTTINSRVCQTSSAANGARGMATQIVMDRTGDTRHIFDNRDRAEVAKAEQRFRELTAQALQRRSVQGRAIIGYPLLRSYGGGNAVLSASGWRLTREPAIPDVDQLVRAGLLFRRFTDRGAIWLLGQCVPIRRKRKRRPLNEWLSAEQRACYERLRYFDVIGCDTGTRYQIHHGTQTNIQELSHDGRRVCKWCFVPDGDLVAGDVMLTQKSRLRRTSAARSRKHTAYSVSSCA